MFSSCSKYFSGSGLVRVYLSTIFKVQVWFRFTSVKCYWFKLGLGSLTKKLTAFTCFVRKKKETVLILLMITTALIVRVSAPAASGYGKIYSYFLGVQVRFGFT